jgi:predicted nucleic acid-binding protein
VIYVDTSVVLAQLLAEDRNPPSEFWEQELISSRLLEYEVWNAIHRRRLEKSHGELARQMIESLAVTELSREILRAAIAPFPLPVRTLDAMHLATVLFLSDRGLHLEVATYDRRMIDACIALAVPLAVC